MTKKKSFRTLAAPLLALAILAAPGSASAQVAFEGTFVGPHGAFSVGFGHPRYAVGSYAPYGYRVVERPRYGHGFWSPSFVCRAHQVRHAHWVPVKRYRQRWMVVERPVYVQPYVHPLERAWGYDDRYRNDRYRDDDDRYRDDDRRGHGHKNKHGKKHRRD